MWPSVGTIPYSKPKRRGQNQRSIDRQYIAHTLERRNSIVPIIRNLRHKILLRASACACVRPRPSIGSARVAHLRSSLKSSSPSLEELRPSATSIGPERTQNNAAEEGSARPERAPHRIAPHRPIRQFGRRKQTQKKTRSTHERAQCGRMARGRESGWREGAWWGGSL